MDWVRRRWLEGRIAAGLGELDKAERELLAARGDFEQAGLAFAAAIVDLDLVAVWLRQGRTREICSAALGGLVDAFRRIGVEREALGAVLLLAEALSRDGMTLELVEATAQSCASSSRRRPAGGRRSDLRTRHLLPHRSSGPGARRLCLDPTCLAAAPRERLAAGRGRQPGLRGAG